MYPYFKTESFAALSTFCVFLCVFSFTKERPDAATTTSTVLVSEISKSPHVSGHSHTVMLFAFWHHCVRTWMWLQSKCTLSLIAKTKHTTKCYIIRLWTTIIVIIISVCVFSPSRQVRAGPVMSCHARGPNWASSHITSPDTTSTHVSMSIWLPNSQTLL